MDSRLLENDGKRGLLNLSPTFVTLVEKRGSIFEFDLFKIGRLTCHAKRFLPNTCDGIQSLLP